MPFRCPNCLGLTESSEDDEMSIACSSCGNMFLVGEALDYAHSLKVIHRDVKSASVMIELAGASLNTICLKAMSKSPTARFPTARALADDLRRWQNGLPIQSRRVSEAERFVRWCRRNPTVAGLLGLLVLVFVAGLGEWNGDSLAGETMAFAADGEQVVAVRRGLHSGSGGATTLDAKTILSGGSIWSGHLLLLLELLHLEATLTIEPDKPPGQSSVEPAVPGPTSQDAVLTRVTSPREIILRDALVIAPTGRFGRSAVHADAVESLMVSGKWTPPKVGAAVTLSDGTSRSWEAITADENAAFRHEALGGGYLYCMVMSNEDHSMVLDAAGHNMVYVNGEPRTGDPYSTGWVRTPVQLRTGENQFLFHVARGELRAQLVEPKAAAQLDPADATLPDLIIGRPVDVEASVVVLNSTITSLDRLAIESKLPDCDAVRTVLPAMLLLSSRKPAFRISGPAIAAEGEIHVAVTLLRQADDTGEWQQLDSAVLTLAAKLPTATHKRTFRSGIDGSVQYFAVVPEKQSPAIETPKTATADDQNAGAREPKVERPALILTLHGAGVEAIGQATCYSSKPGVITVAATNRRPFGFDWEDWGRLDAMEVLEHAQREFNTDPRRTWLTGHSMGGHGTWHVGVTYPDRFAAIGPSAGWVSMFSYAGAQRDPSENPDTPASRIAELLNRCMTPSDTLALSRNYQQQGVYVLHGDKDDNVPVDQARTMRQHLAESHPDFVYYEEPGQGHWWEKDLSAFSQNGMTWGIACVDWPPMFDFFATRRLPNVADVRSIEFVTASPGVSASCHWVAIEAQVKQFRLSTVSLEYDATARRFSGKTDNVARLTLDCSHLEAGQPIQVELDGGPVSEVAWTSLIAEVGGVPQQDESTIPRSRAGIRLERVDGKWSIAGKPQASQKGPHRSGPFKDAFRNHMMFVYGTRGTSDENTWSLAKARFDAEAFRYRGNGSIDVIADTAFDPAAETDRNVIIYGNADTNSAWQQLLANSPIQVSRSRLTIGDRVESGDDLGCLFVRPRPGSDTASVGVISGTGVTGMKLADRLPYFVSGVAYPDCFIFDSGILTGGVSGIRGAGFFGNDWSIVDGEFAWRE